MKKIFTSFGFNVCMLLCFVINIPDITAQTYDRYIITTAGEIFSTSAGTLQFTIGEPVAETFTHGVQLSQGFQQEWAVITAVNDPEVETWNTVVYPNPTLGHLDIEVSEQVTVYLYDLQGHLIYDQKIYAGKEDLNISDLPAGMIVMTLIPDKGGEVQTFKIQKLE